MLTSEGYPLWLRPTRTPCCAGRLAALLPRNQAVRRLHGRRPLLLEELCSAAGPASVRINEEHGALQSGELAFLTAREREVPSPAGRRPDES